MMTVGLVALGAGIVLVGIGAWCMTRLPEWKQYRAVRVEVIGPPALRLTGLHSEKPAEN